MAPGEYDDETQLRREEPTRLVRSWPELAWTDEAGAHKCAITGRTTLGSAPGAQVRVADREVSRLHAELEPTDRGTWVRDLGSRNGTFVENVLVGAALVPDGARIRVGRHRGRAALSGGGVADRAVAGRELRRADRRQHADARAVRADGAGRAERRAGADPRRDRHGQGAGGAGDPRRVGARGRAVRDRRLRGAGELVIEGELFGHARGAFTGAVAARAGSFEAAHGGTIFLDEIGELPLALQPKLLRVLESRTIKRLGESEHRPIDVRLVAATHRDLRRMVNAAAFREDLYFRIAVLPLVLPPLRARKDDIPLLFRQFLGGRQTVEPISERELAEMPWLGNVRELRNFVERVCAIGAKDAMQSSRAAGSVGGTAGATAASNAAAVAFDQPFKEFRERWIDCGEREYLQRLLDRHGRNVPAAAEAAGLDRTYVYRLIRKHGL